jgi:hypothetical protein
MLTLDDHVVHDITIIHDLPHLSRRPLTCGVSDNGKTLLEHTKGSLNILPKTLMTLGKPLFILQVGVTNCLHNCGPLWVDPVI